MHNIYMLGRKEVEKNLIAPFDVRLICPCTFFALCWLTSIALYPGVRGGGTQTHVASPPAKYANSDQVTFREELRSNPFIIHVD